MSYDIPEDHHEELSNGEHKPAIQHSAPSHSQLVSNLCKPAGDILVQLEDMDCHMIHMIMGIAGEVGELLDAIKKTVIYGKPLDPEHVIEELGDIEFYLEGLRQGLGLNRDDILQANITKLQKRYASGSYSDNEAKERADKAESVIIK